MCLRLSTIQKVGNEMSMTEAQIMAIMERYADPSVPDEVKDNDYTLLSAEADQILAKCSQHVDEYVEQIKRVASEGVPVERSQSLLATYLYVSEVPCGEIHNMLVVAMHKLAGVKP
jgi:hypothetical protein